MLGLLESGSVREPEGVDSPADNVDKASMARGLKRVLPVASACILYSTLR